MGYESLYAHDLFLVIDTGILTDVSDIQKQSSPK
jgi:hypothetical protein